MVGLSIQLHETKSTKSSLTWGLCHSGIQFFLFYFISLFIWKRFLCSSGLLIFKLLPYTVYTRKIFGKEALFFSAIVTWKKEELLFPKKSRIKSIMFCLSPSTLIINVSSFLIKIALFYWSFIYIRFPLNIFYNYNRIR